MQCPRINPTILTPASRRKSSIERFHHIGPVHTRRYILICAAPEKEGGDLDPAKRGRSGSRGGVHAEEVVVASVG